MLEDDRTKGTTTIPNLQIKKYYYLSRLNIVKRNLGKRRNIALSKDNYLNL